MVLVRFIANNRILFQSVLVVQDTDRWRQELAVLAAASGLAVERDDPRYAKPPTVDQQHASRSGARYSVRTGRFNEGTNKSRGRTGSKHATPHSDALFSVPENERDMWVSTHRSYRLSLMHFLIDVTNTLSITWY